MRLQENVPLAPQTTLQVGGPARFFVEADSPQALQEAIAFARSRQLKLFVLGGGSNLLVADAGWPGVVVKIAIRGIDQRDGADGNVLFEVGAGESKRTLPSAPSRNVLFDSPAQIGRAHV